MATYRIDWKASASRELKRLDRKLVPTIITTVVALSSNPFPSGVKKQRPKGGGARLPKTTNGKPAQHRRRVAYSLSAHKKIG